MTLLKINPMPFALGNSLRRRPIFKHIYILACQNMNTVYHSHNDIFKINFYNITYLLGISIVVYKIRIHYGTRLHCTTLHCTIIY